jgi:hypothetical protein
MPGLKFRVLLDSEKNEEIFRDILVSDTDNFESFFQAIVKAYNFSGNEMASFYVSNDSWDKGHEISLLDMSYEDDSVDSPSAVMKQAIIKDFISEPDQKFILVYDFIKMWIFLVELIGYERTEPASPEMLLAVGTAPLETSRIEMDDTLFNGDVSEDFMDNEFDDEEDEDDYGFNDFENGYSDDDYNNY